jgi:hypothetical protein
MAAFEEETTAESFGILELARKRLHDGRFASACGPVQPGDVGLCSAARRPFAQIVKHFRPCFGMAFGLRKAFH